MFCPIGGLRIITIAEPIPISGYYNFTGPDPDLDKPVFVRCERSYVCALDSSSLLKKIEKIKPSMSLCPRLWRERNMK